MRETGYVLADDGVRLYFETSGIGVRPLVIPNGVICLDDFQPLAASRKLIAYDPRNRGRSDSVPGDIHRDVEDIEAVRRHFGIEKVDLLGHSYVGLMVTLYAMKFPEAVNRVVQIGPMEPVAGKSYPPDLKCEDGVMPAAFARMGQLFQGRQGEDPVALCREAWAVLNTVYVVNAANAGRLNWGRCELPNELNILRYWNERLRPSLRSLRLSKDVLAVVKAPVLTIHGRMDRNAAYGAGRDWAGLLPDARRVTVENAAHAPWIEAPDVVFGSIARFLDGAWPEAAETV